MTTASQYATSRRSRAACVLEFLALVGIVAIAVLAVAVWGIVKLIDATSLRTVGWWGLVVVLVAGGAFIVFWLGVLEYWDGKKVRHLADEGRGGQPLTVRAPDGTNLHVEIEGPVTAPVTVVFAHGVAMSSVAWRAQRAALADSSARRVSYDARGHGKSAKRKLDQKIRGVRQLADDLGAVIDETAPTGRLVIVGHSLGGFTALALPVVRPDIHERVDGYVFCATSAGKLAESMDFGLWKIMAPVSWLMRRETVGFLCVLDAMPRFVSHLLGLMPYLLALRFLAVHGRHSKSALRRTTAIIYDNGFQQIGDVVLAAMDHDERPELDVFASTRVAVVKGSRDRLVPCGDQQYLADHIPGARLTVVPDCGHMQVFEAADEIEAEIRLMVDSVVESVEPAHPTDVITQREEQEPALLSPSGVQALAGRAASNLTHAAAHRAPSSLTDLAASGVGAVSGALGEVAETVERFTPAGPVRDGVHSLHKKFAVDHPKKRADQ